MTNMMHKDTDMSNLLQHSNMDDNEKQKLYYVNLERYLDLRQQKDSQIPSVRVVKDEKDNHFQITKCLMPTLLILFHHIFVKEPRPYWTD